MTTRTILLTAVACVAVSTATAQSQPPVGYGNNGLGGMTPQPASGVAAGSPTGLEQGFADFANGAESASQEATRSVGTAVDNFGRVIARPFENAGQTISDIAHGPETRGMTTPGQPLRNVVEGTGRELKNTGEAFRDSFSRAGDNIRNTLGVSTQSDPLSQPPPGWSGQPSSVANPSSWGTAADPLASPPPGMQSTGMQSSGVTANDPNAARSVLVNPNTQPAANNRPTWSNSANTPSNATPTNTTMQSSNQFSPPPLQNQQPQQYQPQPQQQPQQPTPDSQLFNRLVDRGPALGNPATGATDGWGNPAPSRSLSPIPGAETPWGGSQPVTTTADTWSDPLRPPFPTQPLGNSGLSMPRLEIPNATTPTSMIDQSAAGRATNPDALNLMSQQTASRPIGETPNQQTPDGGFLRDGNLGWTALWFVLFAGTLTANLYQWFSILDLRNKYRGALRRSSPSLAR